jgi:methylthioribose-1-phosphate isomerase
VAPSSTIDMKIDSGKKVPIENRPAEEVMYFQETQSSLNQTEILNPAFDITPASLIDYIVTEKGIIHEPNTKKMLAIFG